MMYMFRHRRTALSKYEQLPEEARGDYGAGGRLGAACPGYQELGKQQVPITIESSLQSHLYFVKRTVM